MIPMDTLFQRFFIGILVAFMLLGVYAYVDRGRTLECRQTALTNGASIEQSVKACR